MSKQMGFIIDLRRCVGCRTCVVGCKMENDLPEGHQRIRVLNPDEQTVFDRASGLFPTPLLQYRPVPCQHCADPPCVKECPTGAMQKRARDGLVLVDKELCIGCKFCIEACPYGVPVFDEKTTKVDKCTFCDHRLALGKEPFCVLVCPSRALRFCDLQNPDEESVALMASRRATRYMNDRETGPSVVYLQDFSGDRGIE